MQLVCWIMVVFHSAFEMGDKGGSFGERILHEGPVINQNSQGIGVDECFLVFPNGSDFHANSRI